jgi:quinoprotein glucose dehydrogenase
VLSAALILLLAASQEGASEAELALRKLRPVPGHRVSLFAAEPQLRNPVAFAQDERGRWFVVETNRRRSSVLDIRTVYDWLDEDLASRSVEDRLAMYRRHLGTKAEELAVESERLLRIADTDGDGRADESLVFAEGFNTMADGVAAGVAVRGGRVWFTALPNLWLLEDADGDGRPESRRSLQQGWGIRNSYGGHDFHGAVFGPDGKLYLSVGDRGCRVESSGRVVALYDEGGVLRCDPDGSNLEIFARGLRNPQELAFDDAGNLWTVDNNANIGPDNGETGRVTLVLEGADYGWRIGYQHLPDGGPWVREGLWAGKAAYQVPPVGHLTHGPSGLAADPLGGRFLVCDFPGGVRSFTVTPEGAGFRLGPHERFLWELFATDVAFGLDGAVYVLDWVQGFEKSNKGRIFRVEAAAPGPSIAGLAAEGMAKRTLEELADLLAHRDRRVRQAVQDELVRRGDRSVFRAAKSPAARRHAIWGLRRLNEPGPILERLEIGEPEERALAARAVGELRPREIPDPLLQALKHADARVRCEAAASLGRIGRPEAVEPLVELLRANADRDPFLRHGGVMGLAACGSPEALGALRTDASIAVRRAAVLALRRRRSLQLAYFLADPGTALEAARAIYDEPVPEAFEALAAILELPGQDEGVQLRAVNAAARIGRADRLGRAAADAARPPAVRLEALQALGDFAAPPGRDRLLGIWRPSEPRDPAPAKEALERAFEACDADEVRVGALRAAAKLGAVAEARILELAGTGAPATVRAEALRTLAARRAAGLGKAIRAVLAEPGEGLRREALGLIPAAGLEDALELLEKEASEGSPALRQAAVAALGACGPDADAVFVRLLDLRIAGTWPAAAGLELLEAASKRLDAGVRERLARIEAGRPKDDRLAAWSEVLEGGDAAKGRPLFWVRAHASCKQCHSVGKEGGTAGPPLDGVGARLDRRRLLESLLFPSAVIAPGFESVALLLESGAVETGVVVREDADGIVLRQPDGSEKTIQKVQVKSARRGLSAMPDDLGRLLTKRELRDLVEYLAGLR